MFIPLTPSLVNLRVPVRWLLTVLDLKVEVLGVRSRVVSSWFFTRRFYNKVVNV